MLKGKNRANCIIVHGCPSDQNDKGYNKHWIPWVKKRLESRGVKVETPQMPEPWHPDYEKFKQEFEKYKVDEDTILIGHSCGCAFLVRWLGDGKQRIKKLILVAPWKFPWNTNGIGDDFRKAFYDYTIDKSIRSRVGEIVMFTADNEHRDGKKSLEIYHDALGGKIAELKGKGHYVLEDMKTEQFPELLNEVLVK